MIKFCCTVLTFLSFMSFAHAANPDRMIKKLNLNLPFIGLGTVELGRDWGINGANSEKPDDEIVKMVLLTAYHRGWRVIDTASSYQASEELIGRYLPRNQYSYFLITKPGEHSILNNDPRCQKPGTKNQYCQSPAAAYDFSRAAIVRDIHESLKKLNVNKIDLVLLHLQNETALTTLKKGESLQALKDLKQQGLIKYIGVSVNGPGAMYAVEKGDIDFIELEYNLLNQNNKAAIDLAHSKGIGVIVRGGLGTGLLTKSVEAHISDPSLPYGPQVRALLKLTKGNYEQLTVLALAFLKNEPHINTVILGADRPVFIAKDTKLLKTAYDPELLEKAKALVTKFKTPDLYTESVGLYYFK